MFVKKLVEKASLKKPGGYSGSLKPDDLEPRLVFHYGVPTGSVLLAFDSIQKILAIATKDGRVKLFGRNGAQALLESSDTQSSKYLQFLENQGILLRVDANNRIEVWDVEEKKLSHVFDFKKEITSLVALQHFPFVYVGDSMGNVSVLKVDQGTNTIAQMNYHIPHSASRGNLNEAASDHAVTHILPQPTAESKRVLIIYRDGFMALWAIQESSPIFTMGGTALQALSHETKKVTAACWTCPFGSKVATGYSNGEIFIWTLPASSNMKLGQAPEKDSSEIQNAPICKLNLGYKLDKIPVTKLNWTYAEGKANRLYVMGSSDYQYANSLQVVLLNEYMESRTIKLGLHPPELCVDMDSISCFNAPSKHKIDSFVLLGKSGKLYMYDDYLIERYLLQTQSKSSPSLPKEIKVKLPLGDSSITIAKFITDNPCMLCSKEEDFSTTAKETLPFFPCERKDESNSKPTYFSELSMAKNLYITGHNNGAINFWDASCPLLLPVASLSQQSEDDFSLSGIPLTALYCTTDLRMLISGDQSGSVRIYKFKSEFFIPRSGFMFLQGSSKKGNSIFHSVKVVKVNGAVLCINAGQNPKHIAVGSDQGYVSLIDLEGPTILYQRRIESELCTGVISLQFETCSFHGFEKNVIVVATKDSSVLAIETDTGNTLSSNHIRPKKPSRALFMQILDDHEISGQGPDVDMNKENSLGIAKQQYLLLCSEKAIYVYSLVHVVQGVKKVTYKKKFHSASCFWASTFYAPDAALILLFSSGKIEIRSLPDLSLLKETSVRGLVLSTSKTNSICDSSVCCSPSGELLMISGDAEAFFVSILLKREAYRHLGMSSQVYTKDLVTAEALMSEPIVRKEKKKGIFGSVFNDIKGNKTKNGSDMDVEDTRESVEELSTIFSFANFPLSNASEENAMKSEDEPHLDIDDIDLDDPGERPKGHTVMAALNKQNFTNTFQAIKGKLKHMKGKADKTPADGQQEDEKSGAVDQIKKKYGYASSDEPSAANMAKSKLNENLKKLQGINLKTSQMQDSAQSFSSMAREVLRFAEGDKKSS